MWYILSNFYRFVKLGFSWIKKQIIWILLIFLAFGWGIIIGSKILQRPPIYINGDVIDINDLSYLKTADTIKKGDVSGSFVASSRGKYYYPIGCKLADNLSPANLIYFETEENAVKAGYIRQTKCD